MFYYEIKKNLTSKHDTNELQVIGYVEVFLDKEKNEKITELPFGNLEIYLLFKECPQNNKEEYDKFIEDKVIEAINNEKVQNKLLELTKAYEMGLIELIPNSLK